MSIATLPKPREGLVQRRFGGPDVAIGQQGDCWATAVASYAGLVDRERNELHRRIVISDLAQARGGSYHPQEGGEWWNITIRFLAQHGFPGLTTVSSESVQAKYVYIASGPSPRDPSYDHSTLAFGDKTLFWDPHPSQKGVVEIIEWICWWWPE